MSGMQSSLVLFAVSLLVAGGSNASAQVSITSLGTPVTQNFSSLGNSATATLPSGWRVNSSAVTTNYNSAATATTHVGGTDTPNKLSGTSNGGTYNFAHGKANGGNSERAVGWLSGGSNNYATNRNLFVRLVNSTGSTITGLSVGYNIEKYRNGTTQNTISFFGGPDGSTWTSFPAGDHTFNSDGNTNTPATPSSVSKSVSITGISIAPGDSYYLRWNYNGSAAANAQALGIDDFSVSASGSSISVTPASLNFGTVRVGDTSAEQSYTVSGSGLSGLITITAPSGYEISTASGSGFSTSLNLSPSAGSVPSTTIYVRFAPAAHGAANGNISHTSPGTSSQNVAVSGTGDGVPPSVSISPPSQSVTAGGPVSFTVSYTDAASVTLSEDDVIVNSMGTAAATVSVSGSGNSARTVTLSSITGDGTLGISLAAGTAVDAVGNAAGAAGPSATFNVDNTPPTITIGAPSVTETRTGPVTFPVTYGGASAVTLSPAHVTLVTTGTATGDISVSGTGSSSRNVTISNITGDGMLTIQIAAGTAVDSAGNAAPAAGPGAEVTVDSTVPTISTDASLLTPFGTVRVGDVSPEQSYTVGGTGLKGAITITAPSSFEISTTSGSGFGPSLELEPVDREVTSTTVYVRFNPTADGPANGNLVHASQDADPVLIGLSGTGDGVPPGISISAPSAPLVNGGTVTYTITYTDAADVTLTEADVTVHVTGTATATLSLSGSGLASRTATLSGISGDGMLSISVAAGTATDAVGNLAPAAGPSTPFTVDTTPPAIAIGSPSPALSLAGPVNFNVAYSGASSVTLSPDDITLIATGSTTGTVAVTGTGTSNRTVTISGISGHGTLAIAIAAGTASDVLGNLAPAAGPSSAAVIDTEGPAVTFDPPSKLYVRNGTVTYKASYDGAQTITLDESDVIVHTTGTASMTAVDVVGGGPTNRTVRLTGLSGDGEIAISLKAGTAVDSLGNLSPAAGPSLSFFVDNTPPQLVSAVASTTQSIDVTFSELIDETEMTTASYAVAGMGMGSLTAQPDSITAVSTDTYRLAWNGRREMRHGQPLTVSTPVVRDLAGNLIASPGMAIGTGMGEPPQVVSVVPESGQALDITFSEPVDAGALDPLQYTVSGDGQGSVGPNPDSVTQTDETTFRLIWNSGSMVNGASLTVVIGVVSDEAGNPIDPSNSTTITALPVAVSAFDIE